MTTPTDDWIASTEAARLLGIGKNQFHSLANKRGWQVEIGSGRRYMYRRSDIEAERERREDAPPQSGQRRGHGTNSKPKADLKTRKCLTCGTAFQSWGAGNRMCWLCRDYAKSTRGQFE